MGANLRPQRIVPCAAEWPDASKQRQLNPAAVRNAPAAKRRSSRRPPYPTPAKGTLPHASRPSDHPPRWAWLFANLLLGGRRRGRAHQLHVDGNGHVVAYYGGSSIHPEVHAIDLGAGGCAHVRAASRVLHRRRWTIDIEHDFLGDTVNGEIAGDLQLAGAGDFAAFGLEGQDRILGDIEEVRAAQIVVTPFNTCVNGGGINGRLDRGLAEVSGIVGCSAAHLGECSANCRYTHVAHGKLRRGMVGIDLPGFRLSECASGKSESRGYDQQWTSHVGFPVSFLTTPGGQ